MNNSKNKLNNNSKENDSPPVKKFIYSFNRVQANQQYLNNFYKSNRPSSNTNPQKNAFNGIYS